MRELQEFRNSARGWGVLTPVEKQNNREAITTLPSFPVLEIEERATRELGVGRNGDRRGASRTLSCSCTLSVHARMPCPEMAVMIQRDRAGAVGRHPWAGVGQYAADIMRAREGALELCIQGLNLLKLNPALRM